MANITIHGPAQTTDGGAALHLTVRGCEVLALFAPEENTGVYHHIRQVLLDSCLVVFSDKNIVLLDKMRKI